MQAPRRAAPADLLITAAMVAVDARTTLRDGAVLVRGGRLAAVGRRRDLRSASAVPRLDLGRALLTPGLVNAHTHLALTGLGRARMRPSKPGFTAWIRRMLRAGTVPPDDLQAGLAEGARLSLRHGTTAVGDIVPAAVRRAARMGPLAGRRYVELLGFNRACPSPSPERDGEGLAPHAPYSTSAEIYRTAAASGRPLALHLAESEDEDTFTRTGRGPLRALLDELGLVPPGWRPPRTSPVRYLDRLGTLDTAGSLAIHTSFAGGRDHALLRRRGAAVVTCPRSNLALTGRTADLPRLLRAGTRLALGTDSLASSPSLSLLDEMRAAQQLFPSLTAEDLFDLATRGGADALGLDAGTLAVGRRADLAAFRLPGRGDDCAAAIVLKARRAVATVVGGNLLYAQT